VRPTAIFAESWFGQRSVAQWETTEWENFNHFAPQNMLNIAVEQNHPPNEDDIRFKEAWAVQKKSGI